MSFGPSPEATIRTVSPRRGSHPAASLRERPAPPLGAILRRHAATTGCAQNSDRFGNPQTGCTHRRNAPDTLRHCASASLYNGAQIQAGASIASSRYDRPTEISRAGYVPVGLRPRFIQPGEAVTLSERRQGLSVLGPLGAAPSSVDRKREKTAGCLSVSEFPAVPLAVRDGRAPMRSIGARQGVLCFGYFHLDKQMKVTRTTVRNPQPQFTRAIEAKLAASSRQSFSKYQRAEPCVSRCGETPIRANRCS